MLEKSFSLLFYPKKPKNYLGGEMPIYLRITVDGIPKELSTGRMWNPSRWNIHAGRAIGTKDDVKSLNAYLDTLQSKVYEARRRLTEQNLEITARRLKDFLKGKDDASKMILDVFRQHNEEMKNLIGKEYSPATLQRYETSLDHTKSFIEWKYGLTDLAIKRLNYEFVSQYEYWFKHVRNCNHNTSIKYISNFRKIVNRCIRNGWIDRDPFVGFKMTKREVVPEFLTDDEMQRLTDKTFASDRLTHGQTYFCYNSDPQ